jgi:hypothetical protein
MVAKHNLVVYQGSDLRKVLEFKNESLALMDLTGHSFKGQAKTSYSAATPAFNILLTIRDQETSPGVVDLHISSSETAALTLNKDANYLYDIEMTNPYGDVKRVMEGVIKVYPEVTK